VERKVATIARVKMSTQFFARRQKIFAQGFQSLTQVGKERCQFKDEERKVVTAFPGNFLVKASV